LCPPLRPPKYEGRQGIVYAGHAAKIGPRGSRGGLGSSHEKEKEDARQSGKIANQPPQAGQAQKKMRQQVIEQQFMGSFAEPDKAKKRL
jgi:hypothetical protein